MTNPTRPFSSSPFTRRIFIQNALTAAFSISVPLSVQPRILQSQARVVVIRGRDVFDSVFPFRPEVLRRMLDSGMLALTGERRIECAWQRFFAPGERIALKSNQGVPSTYSELHAAILHRLADAGFETGKLRVWDRNRGGIGIEQVYPSEWDWIPGFDGNHISQAVQWADGLINVPSLKPHPRSGFSGALKNWAGAVTGINARDENASFAIHANHCAEIGQLNALLPIRQKCRLIVMDALRVSAPKGKESPFFGGIVLGTDPVAVDRIAWEILCSLPLGGCRMDIPIHLANAANRYGLGVLERENIELISIIS